MKSVGRRRANDNATKASRQPPPPRRKNALGREGKEEPRAARRSRSLCEPKPSHQHPRTPPNEAAEPRQETFVSTHQHGRRAVRPPSHSRATRTSYPRPTTYDLHGTGILPRSARAAIGHGHRDEKGGGVVSTTDHRG